MKKAFAVIAGFLTLVLTDVQAADIPQMINYQGVLLDGDGKAVNGNRSIEFLLYLKETGGTAVWSETQNVTVVEGLFNVMLGSVTAIPVPVFNSSTVYMTLKVGSDEEMTPRKQLVSVGYAYQALNSSHLDGKSPSAFLKAGESNSITADMIAPAFIGSVDGVSNDGGNVDLVAGSNVTITPDDASNTVTISASGGGGSGDNLGNHTATQNIRLNGQWLSNDGGSEGIQIENTGDAAMSKDFQLAGRMVAMGPISSNSNLYAASNITSDGYIRTGAPSTSYGVGDVVATNNVIADNRITSGGDMLCGGGMAIQDHLGVNMGGVSGTYPLYVSGSAYCTGSWQSSDLSLKKNIESADGSISKLLQLRGVSFEWKREEYTDREFDDGLQYGLIAQEVEAAFPELVKTDEKGEKAVNYIGMIPLLIETVKEQQRTINGLQSQINQLKGR